jgi:homoserine acetyltransferase
MVSISSCARSHPSSIAMRYLQRKCIMSDPNWNKGHYYDKKYPKMGMKLARLVPFALRIQCCYCKNHVKIFFICIILKI